MMYKWCVTLMGDFLMGKLLIIGAGGHGRCSAEIARRMNKFDNISFIDDNSLEAIGKIDELEKFVGEYQCAFVAIGNNKIREKICRNVRKLGFELVNLIDPLSFQSIDASYGEGCIFFPFSVVETNAKLGDGVIVCANAVINHDAIVNSYSLINSNSTIRSNACLGQRVKVGSNYVVKFGEMIHEDEEVGEF